MSPQWILVVVLVAVVYFIFIKKKPLSGGQSKSSELSDEMVACKKCDTYISLDEALIKEGNYYCCDECLKA